MTKKTIELTTVGAVKKFVQIMNRCAKSGDVVFGRFTVDACLLMGIFSLDLSRLIYLIIYDDEDESAETLDALDKFAVK